MYKKVVHLFHCTTKKINGFEKIINFFINFYKFLVTLANLGIFSSL